MELKDWISNILADDEFAPSFQVEVLQKLNLSANKVAVIATHEFEGITKNGGIGTHDATLSQKLAAEGWYVILLLCQCEGDFQVAEKFSHLKQVFTTREITQVLTLKDIPHETILSKAQQNYLNKGFDYESFCCLFFIQAILKSLPDAIVYVQFPEIWGFGYRTIQAKQTGLLDNRCAIAVTAHGGYEWLQEINSKYLVEYPQWWWQAFHYEQFSYEKGDLTSFPSYYIQSKLQNYGWQNSSAIYLPHLLQIVVDSGKVNEENCIIKQLNLNEEKIYIIFFGRLEERKGLSIFLEAIQLLEPVVAKKIQIIFLGRIVQLESPQLKHLNSRQYIEEQLRNTFLYNILANLSSQEAIQLVSQLPYPIVCLTSLEDNGPNAALEMGQLPVSIVASDTQGLQEPFNRFDRSDGVYWFKSGDSRALESAITQAIEAYPETPSVPDREFLEQVNQRLLNQRLEYMSQVFLNSAPPNPKNPRVTIGVVCLNPDKPFEDCLSSLANQTYNNLEVIVIYQTSTDKSIAEAIALAQTQFPNYKFVASDINTSLGATYNHLVELATGEYFLQFSAEQMALPFMMEKFVSAITNASAAAVVCPQMRLGEQLEIVNLMDGGLLKLLEFNYSQDVCGLFMVELLKEFPYSEVKGLRSLNWHIIAAAIATGKEVAYYPYPLYVAGGSAESFIGPASLPKERYYLCQYLSQIEPSKWTQRQVHLLLTGIEQLLQSQQQPLETSLQVQSDSDKSFFQSQDWIQLAQQYQAALKQAASEIKSLQDWTEELQYGNNWLQSEVQKAVAEWEKSQARIKELEAERRNFQKIRNAWLRVRRVVAHIKRKVVKQAEEED